MMIKRQIKLVILSFSLCYTAICQTSEINSTKLRLAADIEYLASEELGGREAATMYELMARDYIKASFKNTGLKPFFGDTSYLQNFTYRFGYDYPEKNIKTAKKWYKIDYLYIPPKGRNESININGKFHLYTTDEKLEKATEEIVVLDAGLFEPEDFIREISVVAGRAESSGKKYLILADAVRTTKYDLSGYGRILGNDLVLIQVFGEAAEKILKDKGKKISIEVSAVVRYETACNVAGYIDNNSNTTIVIGAHYDHLGMGAVNSRHTGFPAIHYGADDNASGTAAVMELARKLKDKSNNKHNYILAAFSAEEKGLVGSNYFVENHNYTNRLLCMFNFDMIGRLDTASKILNLNSTGSSPAWDTLLTNAHNNLKLKINKGGISGSDHLAFYLNDIPVVFFFTGLHHDYHTPEDTPDRINYEGMAEIISYALNVTDRLNYTDSIPFSKIEMRESSRSPVRRSVSLGVIPDHVFDGDGMRISGVLEGRTAEKHGLLRNDIITGIGETEIRSIEDYMAALEKLSRGEEAIFTVLREGKTVKIKVEF